MRFEKKYRNWLFSLKNQPAYPSETEVLDKVWSGIEEELILDEAWTAIETSLHGDVVTTSDYQGIYSSTRSPFFKPAIIAAASIAVILFFALLYQREYIASSSIEFNDTETKISTSEKKQNDDTWVAKSDSVESAATPSGIDSEMDLYVDVSKESNEIQLFSGNQQKSQENSKEEKLKDSYSTSIGDNHFLSGSYAMDADQAFPPNAVKQEILPIQNAHRVDESNRNEFERKVINMISFPGFNIPESFLSFNNGTTILPIPSNNNIFSFPKWRFFGAGFSLSFNNSWILSDETFAGLDPANLLSTKVSYAPEIGLNTVFKSHKGHQLRFELFILSEQNQNYNQYIEALYQKRKISLHYTKLHFSWLSPADILYGKIGLGGYYALLTGAEEKVADKSSSLTSLYTRNDYGLSLQYLKEFELWTGFVFAPSFRLQYSLHNIFKGNDIIPSSFRNTHNASAGINMGIYYRF